MPLPLQPQEKVNIIQKPPFYKNRLFYLIIILVLIVILIAGGILYLLNPKAIQNILSPLPFLSTTKSQPNTQNKIIAKVGEENIYQKDLDAALTGLSKISTASQSAILKQQVFDQLIQDSVILQGGQADGLIKLDNTTFNSTNKDYGKRATLVDQVRKAVFDQTPGSKGTVVTVWYKQAKDKSLASDKISQLRQEVADGKITIQQAIDNIKADNTLAKLDPNYQINAGFAFSSQKDRPATTYPEFDNILQSLKPGETSSVYEATKSGFLFGQVSKVVTTTSVIDFSDWLAQKQKIYPVQIFK